MSETTLLALFEDIDPAAEAIGKLHEMGVTDEQINVISGVPVMERMLGRPLQWTNVSRLALGGAVRVSSRISQLGYASLYAVPVGGQPILPVPPGLILLFEMTMLFMLLSTFLGVFLDSYFPNYRPLEYVPEVSDGKIAVFFKCPQDEQEKFIEALRESGAESIKPAEAQQL
jgi:hypothetical protein